MTTKTGRRPYDVLVYGATGFTGQRVARYILQYHSKTIQLAIAGRNRSKLHQLATSINLPIEHVFISSTSESDREKLLHVLSQARVVLSCAGPYRDPKVNSASIVEAAIMTGTDYLDLCGEPQFFEDILVQYEFEARRRGVLVVSACAFDCVPADLSVRMVSRELRRLQKDSAGDLKESGYGDDAVTDDAVAVSGIEVIHVVENITCANSTTFHAAVEGFYAASNGHLKASRNRVRDKFNIRPPLIRPESWPKVPEAPGNLPVYDSRSKSHTLKFMGADASCILASDRYVRFRNESIVDSPPPPRLSVCFGVPTKAIAFQFLAYGAIFSSLARYKWGCKLLHSNPPLFSNGLFRHDGQGPTEEELEGGKFTTYTTAYGLTRDKVVYGKCSGGEPGYVATPRIIVALALTVLRHREKLRFKSGVMLPGAAFGECQEAYKLLREEGIKFDIVKINDCIGGDGVIDNSMV